MGPLTIIYLLHNFPNLNSWIIQFFFGGPFSFELDKFDCIIMIHIYVLKLLWQQNVIKFSRADGRLGKTTYSSVLVIPSHQ